MFEGNRASLSANDIDVFLFGTTIELKDSVSMRADGYSIGRLYFTQPSQQTLLYSALSLKEGLC